MSKLDVNRREFLKITAGARAALAMPTSGPSAVRSKMIGIQFGTTAQPDQTNVQSAAVKPSPRQKRSSPAPPSTLPWVGSFTERFRRQSKWPTRFS
jgi:hypothetical protein